MKKKFSFKTSYGIIGEGLLILFIILFFQGLLYVPINIHSFGFVFELFIILMSLILFVSIYRELKGKSLSLTQELKPIIALIVVFIIALFIGSPYLGGLNNYKHQSKIEEKDFSMIPEFNVSQVQLVDKNTAQQLGDRVFGSLGSDEVSQYTIGEDWTQIAYQGLLYRVTPIDFGGLFKYFITQKTPGFIMVNCETGDAKLVRNEGMKYLKSAYFFKNIQRRAYFINPFALLGEAKFELDDNQKPYWIVPEYKTTWVSKTRDVKGIYVIDAVDGTHTYYSKDEAPSWVDNIYPVSVIYQQFSQSKQYENGLFNWSKKGIVEFTDDYAYVLFDNNVHIYTGVTSVGKDESNVGFAYINLRSGDISYIRKAGAEEYSARSSAEGAVQQYHYTAIFPSMVNVKNHPTYFMGLVDSANLIKSFAFVNYENYQIVATGSSVDEAYKNYVSILNKNNPIDNTDEVINKEFVVSGINTIVKDGNTILLFKDDNNNIYWYDMSDGDFKATFIELGSRINVSCDNSGRIIEILN